MLDFETFRTLYGEAKEYDNEERYIMERGWQEWMDDTDSAVDTLRKIYAIGKKGFPALVQQYKTMKQMCNWMTIPYTTAQKWNNGSREPAEYIIMLIAYATLNTFDSKHTEDESKD